MNPANCVIDRSQALRLQGLQNRNRTFAGRDIPLPDRIVVRSRKIRAVFPQAFQLTDRFADCQHRYHLPPILPVETELPSMRPENKRT